MKNKNSYSVYFAGDLFDVKDLMGNAIMAEAIEKCSNGKFKCILPQDLEQNKATPKAIRDSDILNLLSSDIAIFNFDGSELDSGTVVEFMLAKFADIPALQLRTDFRNGGDCKMENSTDDMQIYPPWNLMASFYPRSEVLLISSAVEYSKVKEGSSVERIGKAIENIARKIVEAFERLIISKPILKDVDKIHVYSWLMNMPNLDSSIKAKLKRVLSKK